MYHFPALLLLELCRSVQFRLRRSYDSVVLNRLAIRKTNLFPFSHFSLVLTLFPFQKKKIAPTFSPWPDAAFINAQAEIFTSESRSDGPQMCPVSSDEAEHGKIITMEILWGRDALGLLFQLSFSSFYFLHCSFLLSVPFIQSDPFIRNLQLCVLLRPVLLTTLI